MNPSVSKAGREPAPSWVNPRFCTGCEQCYHDCPYEAISMVQRDDGRDGYVGIVDPSVNRERLHRSEQSGDHRNLKQRGLGKKRHLSWQGDEQKRGVDKPVRMVCYKYQRSLVRDLGHIQSFDPAEE